jgi:hypothetical protein
MANNPNPGFAPPPTAQQQANLAATNPTAPKNTAAAAPASPSMQSFFAPAQYPASSPGTVINPGIPGQPFMGNNSAQANQQANQQAGTGQQGQQVQGTPVQSIMPVQIQPQNQSPAQQAVSSVNPQNQSQQPQQTLNQVAPQALVAQSQISQQNQQQAQPFQFQQPQIGGFPVQQTQPQLLPTGNLSTPQTVTDTSQQPTPQIDPNTQVQAYNNSTGQSEMVSPDDPRFGSGQLMQNPVGYQTGQTTPQQNIINALQSNSQQDFSSMLQNAMQAGPNASGASLLQLSLQQQLGAIDDPNINTYLNNQKTRTQQAYEMGMGYNSAQSNELQEAINGTLTNPQTIVGAQAAQAKAAQGINLQTLSAQSQWNQAQQAATTDQLQTKRADLEGFLKAQLALSSGSDTSPASSALTVMSQSLHEADINMTLQNAGYTFGQNQLSIQGSQVMNDYTNQVLTLGAQVNQQRMQVTSDYYSGLNSIDQNALANEQQKRQLTATAYGTYSQQMLDLSNNEQNRQVQYAQLAHQTIQDNITDANQISGTTGIVYQPDGKGGFQQALDEQGNPIQTLTAKQNQFTDNNMTGQLGLQSWQANATIIQSIASNLTSVGDFKSAANVIEQITGSAPGSIPTSNGQEFNNYISTHISGASQTLQQVADGTKNQIPQGIQQIFGVNTNGGQCGIYAGSISTAPNVGNTWAQKIATVQAHGSIQNNPQPGYKMLIPLGVNTDGQEPGHVETVVSYDPKTQNMLLAQSNMDLKGTVSMDIQNVGELKQKYGSNWGFVPGQLKPGIQQQLSAYTAQNGSQINVQPQGQVDWDKVAGALSNAGGGFAQTASNIANYTQSENDATAGMTPGLRANIMSQVQQINPNYNENQYTNNQTYLSNWQGTQTGTTGFKNQSINNAFNALSSTYDAVKKLPVGNFNPTNALSNIIRQNLGSTAVSNVYSEDAPVVAELAKAFTGSTPDADTLLEYKSLFNPNQSQQQFLQNIQNLGDSLGKQLNTNVEDYKNTIGTYPKNTLTSDAIASMTNMQLKPSTYDPSLQMSIPTTSTTQALTPTSFNMSGSNPPTDAGSKIQSALQAGYAPQDVITYLESDPVYGSSIKSAQQAGYTPQEIMNFLNQ